MIDDSVLRGELREALVLALQRVPELAGRELVLTTLSGGITNRLYRLSWQNESVLVRLYGDNTEAFIDRKVENSTFMHTA